MGVDGNGWALTCQVCFWGGEGRERVFIGGQVAFINSAVRVLFSSNS